MTTEGPRPGRTATSRPSLPRPHQSSEEEEEEEEEDDDDGREEGEDEDHRELDHRTGRGQYDP